MSVYFIGGVPDDFWLLPYPVKRFLPQASSVQFQAPSAASGFFCLKLQASSVQRPASGPKRSERQASLPGKLLKKQLLQFRARLFCTHKGFAHQKRIHIAGAHRGHIVAA